MGEAKETGGYNGLPGYYLSYVVGLSKAEVQHRCYIVVHKNFWNNCNRQSSLLLLLLLL